MPVLNFCTFRLGGGRSILLSYKCKYEIYGSYRQQTIPLILTEKSSVGAFWGANRSADGLSAAKNPAITGFFEGVGADSACP